MSRMNYERRFAGGGIERRPGAKSKNRYWNQSFVASKSGPVRHIDPATINGGIATPEADLRRKDDLLLVIRARTEMRSRYQWALEHGNLGQRTAIAGALRWTEDMASKVQNGTLRSLSPKQLTACQRILSIKSP